MQHCLVNDMKQADIISLKVLTPENIICEKMVEKVSLPGAMGRFMILKNHAPLISSLEKGAIVYVAEGHEQHLEIHSGFVEVLDNKVVVCAEV